MNPTYQNPAGAVRTRALTAVAASLAFGATLAMAAAGDMYEAPAPTPGGVRAQAVMSPPVVDGTNTIVSWYGMQGWYNIERQTNGGAWQTVGRVASSDFAGSAVVPNGGVPGALFRLNQNNAFSGSGTCAGCHGDKYAEWANTGHATAMSDLSAIHMDTNPSCVVCHSVGFGQPTGYVDATATPALQNVGCETCHGPAAWHKYSDHDLIRPAVSIDAKICGSCHTDTHHPTYEEWSSSGHAQVVAELEEEFLDPASGVSRIASCGACHSGAMRLAQLNNYKDQLNGYTNALVMPTQHDAAEYAQTCAVCHDPHSDANTAQLRNPLFSTNYYGFSGAPTSTTIRTTNSLGVVTTNVYWNNAPFVSAYNPNIQVCAQCHNSRGATWSSTSSRPPHHSPQYNLLIGIIQPGYFNTNASGVATNWLFPHGAGPLRSGGFNTNGCVTCHMPSYAVDSTHNVTGHTFEMNERGCTTSGCHSSVPYYEETQESTTNSITRIVALLNQWAVTKGAALGLTNGANNWDSTTTGALAPTPNTANAGPADQSKVPSVIKQARFNTYMVLHDGSLGVHNPSYTSALLADAENKVLGTFPVANFKATTATAGFAGMSVTFTNMGTGVTGYSWNFGNGQTSTAATPTVTYATPGVYDVTLTATTATGSETVTRAAYIIVSEKPVVSFTATPSTGKAPLTVNFVNTSTAISEVTAFRWTIDGNSIYSTNTTYTFTNTTPAGYNITLRAYTAGGRVSTTVTNAVTITP